MKYLGIIIILFGAVDLIGGFTGFDLWGSIGVNLPDIVWKYSAYLELILGFFLFRLGSNSSDTTEEE